MQTRPVRVDTDALLDLLPDVVIVMGPDGTIAYANAAVERALGWPIDQVVGRSAFDFVHPDEQAEAVAEIAAQVAADDEETRRHHVELAHAAGHFVKFEMLAAQTPVTDDSLLLVLRDISEREADQKRLHLRDEQLRALAENVPDAVGRFDRQARLVFASRRFGEVVDQHPDLIEAWTAHATSVLESGQLCEVEVELASSTGLDAVARPQWLAARFVPELDPEGAVNHVLVIATDVTLRKENELRLIRAASYDQLTGLLNRTRFRDATERSLVRLAANPPTGEGVTLIFIDLDDFKVVNDTHGHLAGDDVLVAVGRRLAGLVRPGDLVGRYGGDEFVMLCHEVSPADADAIAARIVESLAEPVALETTGAPAPTVSVGASVGVARAAAPTTFDDLLVAADAAMYRAKAGTG